MSPPSSERPRVGIDGHHLGSFGGNRSYASALLRALARAGSSERFALHAYGPRSADDPASLAGLSSSERAAFAWGRGLPAGAVRRTALAVPLAHRRDRLELWHAAFVAPPFARARVVLAVHDVLPLTRPELFSPLFALRMRVLLPRSIARARRVLVPTEHVRGELESLGLGRQKTVVAPIGVDDRVFHARAEESDARVRETSKTGDRYVLAVGRPDVRKRFALLERVFARVARPGERLVAAGPFGDEVRPKSDSVVFVRSPDEPALAALYRGARALVFPTSGEGLGLPVVEALACGCPVIATDHPAIREAAQGRAFALLKEVNFEQELGEAIRGVLDSDPIRVPLATKYSLEAMAQATESAWREALAE